MKGNMRLRLAILEKFGSQEKMAVALGINETQLSKYCRGLKRPHPKHIRLISEALGVLPEELFPEEVKRK